MRILPAFCERSFSWVRWNTSARLLARSLRLQVVELSKIFPARALPAAASSARALASGRRTTRSPVRA
jgi:hypothetical protein